ncbi:hypothetical protein QEZ40_002619 [Streptomyces katrae]|uniref:Lipoprotein n=1 Tax=Streptomyces katrae TaxID=68223 RepID=A0ABT7GWM6_9ACTN|nr:MULTISPECIES: hypothetical protein [Streptomyces]MDK9497676.1 hypothetical protein [Streptomyces katrae]RST08827.1 hypothetical protein EF910_00910 [Streptomyces sp. WAC07149]
MPRSRRRPRASALTVLTVLFPLALTAAGCSAAPSDGVRAEPVPTPTAGTVVGLRLPIGAYLPTDTERALSEYLRGLLVRDCVRRHGASFMDPAVTGGAAPPAAYDPLNMARRYGVGDMETARRYGYRVDPAHRAARVDGPSGAAAPARTAEERGLLTGVADRRPGQPSASGERPRFGGRPVPDGGCYGEADRALLNDGSRAGAFGGTVNVIERQGYERSRRDPRVREAFTRWSACMKAKGHHYADPLGAAGDTARWRPDATQEAGPDERATAVADMECKRDVNLLGVWFAVESEYENTAMAGRAAELETVRRQLEAERGRLRELAAGRP